MTILLCSLVMLVLLFADQITKAIAHAVNVHQSFLPGFMDFNYIENTGIGFSMFDNNPTAMAIITAITVLMIIGIGVIIVTLFKKNKPAQFALAVIEAGAIGNLIDRLCLVNGKGLHFVRDFLDVSKLGFGVCNLADFFITFGAVALLFIILFIGSDAVFPLTKKWREQAKEREEQEKKKKHGK